jgi:hypothetical protein
VKLLLHVSFTRLAGKLELPDLGSQARAGEPAKRRLGKTQDLTFDRESPNISVHSGASSGAVSLCHFRRAALGARDLDMEPVCAYSTEVRPLSLVLLRG